VKEELREKIRFEKLFDSLLLETSNELFCEELGRKNGFGEDREIDLLHFYLASKNQKPILEWINSADLIFRSYHSD
jgi:hypothetical protein